MIMEQANTTTPRPRLAAVVGIVGASAFLGVGVLAGGSAASAAETEPTSPADLPEPTSKQLSGSVHTWEPNNVHQWDLENAVTELATEGEEGSDSVITLSSDVLFEFGSAKIPDNAAEAVVKTLEKVPDGTKVDISGYTDSVGDDSDNQKLSEKRAKAVAEVVKDARSDLDLNVEGHGEDDPVAENKKDGEDNPEGRAKNRRVEIRYASS
ncbi:Outer membrane protein OmpA [Brevibacterium sandarakinum]|uniref:Outer membrane protein OmpA n=1 Tax=Brevibacterium sandarakinum TaxID=629680 RepID=A0A1H1QNX8_BRESA|nr:OmpA family protein [Brevibacterium sandarakinum]SDS25148.1 Outer membrane protein OmpA [Brevibacterium sandarakinum]